MNRDGFFAVWPDVGSRNRLNMLSILLGLDSDLWADYHVTLMYDPKNTHTPDIEIPITAYKCHMVGVALYNGSLVIELESPELRERYVQLLEAGKIPKYPDFKPHVTLVPEFGTEDQVSFLSKYVERDRAPLVFGNETHAPADNG